MKINVNSIAHTTWNCKYNSICTKISETNNISVFVKIIRYPPRAEALFGVLVEHKPDCRRLALVDLQIIYFVLALVEPHGLDKIVTVCGAPADYIVLYSRKNFNIVFQNETFNL